MSLVSILLIFYTICLIYNLYNIVVISKNTKITNEDLACLVLAGFLPLVNLVPFFIYIGIFIYSKILILVNHLRG